MKYLLLIIAVVLIAANAILVLSIIFTLSITVKPIRNVWTYLKNSASKNTGGYLR